MKILNVGIPRTGTTFVSQALTPNVGHGHYGISGDGYINYTTGKRDTLDRDTYIIGFVRNPFDLLVSHYEILQGERFRDHPHAHYARCTPFPGYVRALWNNRIPPKQGVFPRGGKETSLFFQLWDLDTDHTAVDYLGRFETMEQDLEAIARITGANLDKSLGKLNASPQRRHYQTYYEDDQFNREVWDRYEEDLHTFGYHFNGRYESCGVEYGER